MGLWPWRTERDLLPSSTKNGRVQREIEVFFNRHGIDSIQFPDCDSQVLQDPLSRKLDLKELKAVLDVPDSDECGTVLRHRLKAMKLPGKVYVDVLDKVRRAFESGRWKSSRPDASSGLLGGRWQSHDQVRGRASKGGSRRNWTRQ
jgi:hypothetical protein